MKERKIEITIETCEVLVIRRRQLSHQWCASCGKPVAVISVNDAYSSGLSSEAIQRRVEAGRIHLIQVSGGSSLICLNSLIHTGNEKNHENQNDVGNVPGGCAYARHNVYASFPAKQVFQCRRRWGF